MLLYKFKSFENLEHIQDLVEKERLYCAPYDKLNDPFEGQFQALLPQPLRFVVGSSRAGDPLRKFKEHKSVNDIPFHKETRLICSLTSDPSEVRMWSFYAEGHKGVAFEFDFNGIETSPSVVNYVPVLPEFGNTLLTMPFPAEVFTYKTKHWVYESEYRIIASEPYFSVLGRLKRVILGWRASAEHAEFMRNITPAHIPVLRATLDPEGVRVRT